MIESTKYNVDNDPIFDKEQKYAGFNKHAHYQFGSHTCPGCKSDDTQKRKDGLLTCLVCNFVFS